MLFLNWLKRLFPDPSRDIQGVFGVTRTNQGTQAMGKQAGPV